MLMPAGWQFGVYLDGVQCPLQHLIMTANATCLMIAIIKGNLPCCGRLPVALQRKNPSWMHLIIHGLQVSSESLHALQMWMHGML